MSFENENCRKSHSDHYLPKAAIKYYNVMIDGENSNFKIYEKIRKIATSKGDDYTTGCLLGYTYFKENYKMIAVDVSKQQALHAVSRAI